VRLSEVSSDALELEAVRIDRDATPEYDHEPLEDGYQLALGALRPRASHTPGHRHEHTTFPLVDTSRVAVSLLPRAGATEVMHVVDGRVPLWQRRGWPLERLRDPKA
jgi:hypothetical protein